MEFRWCFPWLPCSQGASYAGQLGDGDTELLPSNWPVPVAGGRPYATLQLGRDFACALEVRSLPGRLAVPAKPLVDVPCRSQAALSWPPRFCPAEPAAPASSGSPDGSSDSSGGGFSAPIGAIVGGVVGGLGVCHMCPLQSACFDCRGTLPMAASSQRPPPASTHLLASASPNAVVLAALAWLAWHQRSKRNSQPIKDTGLWSIEGKDMSDIEKPDTAPTLPPYALKSVLPPPGAASGAPASTEPWRLSDDPMLCEGCGRRLLGAAASASGNGIGMAASEQPGGLATVLLLHTSSQHTSRPK